MALKPSLYKPLGSRRPQPRKLSNRSVVLLALLIALICGCSTQTLPIATSFAQVSGNWQFNSAVGTSVLPGLAGSLAVTGNQVTGTLHPVPSPYNCLPSKTSFPVTGAIDSNGKMTLNSSAFTGGNFTLTAQTAAAQSTLSSVSYGVSNGICAVTTASAVGTRYVPISGTYAGTISSDSGTSLNVSTVFSQTTAPDANGTYHLQGTSSFGAVQPCLPTAPTVTDSTVTGSSLAATYTEVSGGTTITVNVQGTFAPDASTLTLTSYAITGGYCDGDTGHGTLTFTNSGI